MSESEIEAITKAVVSRIQDKYFLIEKTFDLRIEKERKTSEVATKQFIDLLVNHLCDYYKIERSSIVSGGRKKKYDDGFTISEMRFMIYAMCTDLPEKRLPLRVIADYFNKDHATIMNGLTRHEGLVKFNRSYAHDYRQIVESVNAAMRIK